MNWTAFWCAIFVEIQLELKKKQIKYTQNQCTTTRKIFLLKALIYINDFVFFYWIRAYLARVRVRRCVLESSSLFFHVKAQLHVKSFFKWTNKEHIKLP